ncbi:MAG: recombination mediator RecR [bacterium]
MNALEPLEKLASLFRKLPGVGRRSAERMVHALARDRNGLVRDLITALRDVDAQVTRCGRCGNVTLRSEDPCSLCTDARRDDRLLCVVDDPADILLIERAGAFRGRYHSLGGRLSPARGEGVREAGIESLLARIARDGITEVMLALDADVESDATSSFIHDAVATRNVRVTRLARGIPAGSGIAYADHVTLARAIEGRQVL